MATLKQKLQEVESDDWIIPSVPTTDILRLVREWLQQKRGTFSGSPQRLNYSDACIDDLLEELE